MEKSVNTHSCSIDELKNVRVPLLIFGAGATGEALLQICRLNGIAVTGLCDNSSAKTDTILRDTVIYHPSQLKNLFPEAFFLIGVADIQDIVTQLHTLGYDRWSSCLLLENQNTAGLDWGDRPKDFIDFAINTCLLCHRRYLEPDRLFLRSVDVMVTERCSLRCKDCSNLMQYYQKPRNFELDELYAGLDAMLAAIDEINDCRVIGGEPLMHREVHQVVSHLTANPKVKRVAIYTNGTILPRPEQMEAFRHPKVLFLITDYGPLSKRLTDLVALLQAENITSYVHPGDGWTACSGIGCHNRSAEQLQQIFSVCCARNLLTLCGTKLYRCPFIANAAQLRAIPTRPENYVDLAQGDSVMQRTRISEFIAGTTFFPGCDYCDGRSWTGTPVPAAVQATQPLPYQTCQEQ